MSFGNFLKAALPVAAGILGTPALGAAVGAGMSLLGSRGEARAQQAAGQAAGQQANQGFDYLSGSPIGTQYLPGGAAAFQQQQALLGLGGDTGAAQRGYNNYLNSIGFQGQLQQGVNAINSSAAASGALGSGATLRALQGYGQQLGQQSFNNYLGHLGQLSNQGMQAGGMLGQAAQAGGAQAAHYGYAGAQGAAGARRDMWDALGSGVGGILEAFGNRGQGGGGQSDPAPAAAPRSFPTLTAPPLPYTHPTVNALGRLVR